MSNQSLCQPADHSLQSQRKDRELVRDAIDTLERTLIECEHYYRMLGGRYFRLA